MGLMDGRIAVVTGASRGIGRAVSIAYAQEGAKVALAARTTKDIEEAAHEIESAGGTAIAVTADVTKQADVDNLFARASTELGPVDVLVNNAGVIGPTGNLWEIPIEEWEELYDFNVTSVVRCCQAVMPSMIERHYGKIINVGSTAGWSDGWAGGFPEQSAYASSKGAIIRFSQVFSHQARRHGVNVNCVGVGADTYISYYANVLVSKVRGTNPPTPHSERDPASLVSPADNVGAFVFLASELGDHIAGAYFEANTFSTQARQRR